MRVRRAALAGDGVDALDVLRAEVEQRLGDEADAFVLAHTGAQRPVQLLVGGVDHRAGVGEQEDLVGGLDPARLQEHLLAVDDAEAARREGGEDGHLDEVDAERLVRQTVLGEDVVDLGGDVLGEPGSRGDGAAQRRQPGPRAMGVVVRLAGRAGVGVAVVEPRVVQLVVAGRRTEVPDDRIAAAWDQGEADQLVDRPRADVRRRGIADVGEVEAQQRSERRLLERLVQPGQPLRAQPVHVDADFPVDIVRSEGADRHGVVLRPAPQPWMVSRSPSLLTRFSFAWSPNASRRADRAVNGSGDEAPWPGGIEAASAIECKITTATLRPSRGRPRGRAVRLSSFGPWVHYNRLQRSSRRAIARDDHHDTERRVRRARPHGPADGPPADRRRVPGDRVQPDLVGRRRVRRGTVGYSRRLATLVGRTLLGGRHDAVRRPGAARPARR